MKKNLLITITLLLLLVLASCSPRQQEPTTTYTDEFAYLPKHPSMVLREFEKGEDGEYSRGDYDISDDNTEEFLAEYEELLVSDGWTITQDDKPMALTVEKEEHQAFLIIHDVGEEKPILTIMAK